MVTRSNATTDITFTAKRKLAGTTTIGESVTITTYLPEFNRSTVKSSSQSKSIDGTVISTLNHYAEVYQCKTPGIDAANIDVWEMFIYSTMNGEAFSMTNRDESGRVMTNVKRTGQYSRERVHRLFAYYRYSFQVRELI